MLGPGPAIEVDGGIDVDTAGPCASAGATAFVAGTAVFGADDPAEAFRKITAATGTSQP
jgi:ribulose-phosphate 3-epimerase